MKQNVTILILCVALATLIGTAAFFYGKLSAEYVPSVVAPDSTKTTDTSNADTDVNTAPDFEMVNGSGEILNLSDLFGKPIVLNFWATWCPPCKAELPYFESSFNTYGENVHFIMLNQTDGARDTVEVVRTFISKNGYTFPVYYDSMLNATYAYSAFSIPMTVFIDANGNVVDQHIGMISEDKLVASIEELIK